MKCPACNAPMVALTKDAERVFLKLKCTRCAFCFDMATERITSGHRMQERLPFGP